MTCLPAGKWWSARSHSLNLSSFSTSRPEQLPIYATLGADSSAGMAITHSFVARKAAKL